MPSSIWGSPPCSMFQYSDIAPRLLDQNFKFFKFFLSINSQKDFLGYKETTPNIDWSLTWKPLSHIRILASNMAYYYGALHITASLHVTNLSCYLNEMAHICILSIVQSRTNLQLWLNCWSLFKCKLQPSLVNDILLPKLPLQASSTPILRIQVQPIVHYIGCFNLYFVLFTVTHNPINSANCKAWIKNLLRLWNEGWMYGR